MHHRKKERKIVLNSPNNLSYHGSVAIDVNVEVNTNVLYLKKRLCILWKEQYRAHKKPCVCFTIYKMVFRDAQNLVFRIFTQSTNFFCCFRLPQTTFKWMRTNSASNRRLPLKVRAGGEKEWWSFLICAELPLPPSPFLLLNGWTSHISPLEAISHSCIFRNT